MAKPLIAVFISANAGHIPSTAQTPEFTSRAAQIPCMKKGKGYVNLQNKLPAYMLEGLKVGINLLF